MREIDRLGFQGETMSRGTFSSRHRDTERVKCRTALCKDGQQRNCASLPEGGRKKWSSCGA